MKYLIKSLLLFSVPFVIVFFVTPYFADGTTDDFYLKFTTPVQKSMIIGVSKAEQGLIPSVFNSELKNTYPNLSMYNFAFTGIVSPYGKIYYEAIKNRVDKNSKNGLFIVTIDRWSISSTDTLGFHDDLYIEEKGCLNTTKTFGMNPNYFYLLNSYQAPYLSIILKKAYQTIYPHSIRRVLHSDGWLEIIYSLDNGIRQKRLNQNLVIYNKMVPHYKISPQRLNYFIQTLRYLKQYGVVFIVQMPINEKLADCENKAYPLFESLINSISIQEKTPYLNYQNQNEFYNFTDGVHLWKTSGYEFTKTLCRDIRKYKK
jgi:hypothetical protein